MPKIEKIIFYLFIFLLPFQVGKFLFAFSPLPNFFYHQFFIYLSDIFIVGLLGFWLFRILKSKQFDIFYANLKKDIFLALFFMVAGISILVAGSKILAIMHFIKLTEFILFYFYIKNNFVNFSARIFSCVLVVSALFQALIAGLQFYFQRSLGMRHLGESVISPIAQNVAKINEGGYKLMRAYGTFPHPNVLAVFLLFACLPVGKALFMSYYAYLNNKAEIRHNEAGRPCLPAGRQESDIPPLPYYFRIRQTINYLLTSKINKVDLMKSAAGFSLFFILVLGLFLTFSRIAVASFLFISLAVFIILFISKNKINIGVKKIYKSIFLSLIIFIVFLFIFNKELSARLSDGDSTNQRIFYNNIAIKAIAHSPIFGIGIGNFVNYFHDNITGLPDWQYQPAHNLFLLIIAEIGLVGGILFILFVSHAIHEFIKKGKHDLFGYIMLFVVINFLIIANFDHYFWTLQQGQILFWLVIGIFNHNKNNALSIA